ncbi:GntR family transcriptional regulator [Aquirufa sp. ROCK2-A2]
MSENNLFHILQIDAFSSTPKYLQIANSVIEGIRTKKIKKGDVLPSINELSFENYISRITVEKSYNYLKSKGIIASVRGKGFYILVDNLSFDLRVFLLFNKLSEHKKIIYDSFVEELGENASVDFFIYNNDFNLFKKIIQSRDRDYSHIVIIPHFLDGEENARELINHLPKEKLYLVDKLLPGIQGNFGAVYENFEKDIFNALSQISESLKKYHTLKIIFPNTSYYPLEIVNGFMRFCQHYGYEREILSSAKDITPKNGELYICVMENDLILLLDKILESKLELGQDVGIISYNETPLKRLLFRGITTVSTDFINLGTSVAQLIKANSKEQIENPFQVIARDSI